MMFFSIQRGDGRGKERGATSDGSPDSEGDLLEMGRELEKLFVEKILKPALEGEVENDY